MLARFRPPPERVVGDTSRWPTVLWCAMTEREVVLDVQLEMTL
jgi:hypothetical protein